MTQNTRDFPRTSLAPFGIRAQRPDSFVAGLLDTVPERVVEAVRRQRQAYTNPSLGVEELLDSYARSGLDRTAERLARFSGQL